RRSRPHRLPAHGPLPSRDRLQETGRPWPRRERGDAEIDRSEGKGRAPARRGALPLSHGLLSDLAPNKCTMAVSPLENHLDLTLFVVCYNEEENIVGTMETVLEALGEFDFTWEIIIIDDASKDRSVEIIQDFLSKHPDLPITLKVREFNVGLGQNYIEAAFLG